MVSISASGVGYCRYNSRLGSQKYINMVCTALLRFKMCPSREICLPVYRFVFNQHISMNIHFDVHSISNKFLVAMITENKGSIITWLDKKKSRKIVIGTIHNTLVLFD